MMTKSTNGTSRSLPGAGGTRRIAFINPFGTDAYDGIIKETLGPFVGAGTAMEVRHLNSVPPNIDYFWPKHLVEKEVLDEIMRLEAEDFDAYIVGCCYDPAVRVARELTDRPVVGPLEAALNLSGYYGHRCTVITDHRKAQPYLEDLVRIYGAGNCRGVRSIDWFVTDMIKDPAAVAKDAAEACLKALAEDQSEVVILGCTIIGGCLQKHINATGQYAELPILNPNLMALKMAEMLADLSQKGLYQISRSGFYQKHQQHDAAEAADYLDRYGPEVRSRIAARRADQC